VTKRPNIVVILVDDMGYSDLGCYGGEIQTPTLDALADSGVRFTQFYNTARCCPARASLLTGLYPHQTGVGWMVCSDMGGALDGYAGDLNERCRTFGEVLGAAGYRTYLSGKWHVTSEQYLAPDASKHSWPVQRGFDRFYGILSGASNYYSPPIVADNDWIGPEGMDEESLFTDAIAERAADFIRDHVAETPDRPFVEYVAFTAPHWPLHARQETIDAYVDVYTDGWDAMRPAKYARMQAMGVIEDHWDLSKRGEGIPDWESLPQEKQDEFVYRMAVYSAQVDEMDQGVGRIVAALKEAGQFENTLILFMSDNGGCAEEIHRGDYDDWREIGQAHTFESYGKPWANYSNTPFREYKHWVHEGGIATPLIAHWPAGIADPGRICRQPGHLIDIMPTLIELAEAGYPPDAGADDVHTLPGRSLTPAFRGQPITREQIFWEHEANRALRRGRWKLVAKGVDGPWELYDMTEDRTETHDLADRYPDRVEEMAGRWDAVARVTDVYPLFGDVPGFRYQERAAAASWKQSDES
jgi:arylsulfatase A-like enzyme